jgi:hypothetical protein
VWGWNEKGRFIIPVSTFWPCVRVTKEMNWIVLLRWTRNKENPSWEYVVVGEGQSSNELGYIPIQGKECHPPIFFQPIATIRSSRRLPGMAGVEVFIHNIIISRAVCRQED